MFCSHCSLQKQALLYCEATDILKTITTFGVILNYGSYFKVVSEMLQPWLLLQCSQSLSEHIDHSILSLRNNLRKQPIPICHGNEEHLILLF